MYTAKYVHPMYFAYHWTIYEKCRGIQSYLGELDWKKNPIKSKICVDGNFVFTGGKGGHRYDNLSSMLLTPTTSWQRDNSRHYCDVIMGAVASQITSLTIVYSTVYSDTVQRKHQSSASLAFVWGIHRGPVNSPHKWPVTRKMFPFDDVIMAFREIWCIFILYIYLDIIFQKSLWPWARPITECIT